MSKRWQHIQSIVETPADLKALYDFTVQQHETAVEEGQAVGETEMGWRIRKSILEAMLTQSLEPGTAFPPKWEDASSSTRDELKDLPAEEAQRYGATKKTQRRRHKLHELLLDHFGKIPHRLASRSDNGELDKEELTERFEVGMKTIEKDLSYLRTEIA